ncbi:hypothetical protein [Pseudonocardia nigra]|uniref:hypothetical protein n=1 Tax=Pseudonocardia nigra TaxID=1921578 RepID=UPI001C5FC11B|nr:hypothetical protein [Pseudonocardia nigra]
MELASSRLIGWYIGFAVAVVVIGLVAVLLVAITATVRKIALVAENIAATLEVARDRTQALWDVSTTNQVAHDILESATAARTTLERS